MGRHGIYCVLTDTCVNWLVTILVTLTDFQSSGRESHMGWLSDRVGWASEQVTLPVTYVCFFKRLAVKWWQTLKEMRGFSVISASLNSHTTRLCSDIWRRFIIQSMPAKKYNRWIKRLLLVSCVERCSAARAPYMVCDTRPYPLVAEMWHVPICYGSMVTYHLSACRLRYILMVGSLLKICYMDVGYPIPFLIGALSTETGVSFYSSPAEAFRGAAVWVSGLP